MIGPITFSLSFWHHVLLSSSSFTQFWITTNGQKEAFAYPLCGRCGGGGWPCSLCGHWLAVSLEIAAGRPRKSLILGFAELLLRSAGLMVFSSNICIFISPLSHATFSQNRPKMTIFAEVKMVWCDFACFGTFGLSWHPAVWGDIWGSCSFCTCDMHFCTFCFALFHFLRFLRFLRFVP